MEIIRGLVHRRLLPRFAQQYIWNREYATGQWDSRSLHTPNDPIYAFLEKYCVDRDVVDIGSGHGNTITEMSPVYRSYTGVDISDAALRIAAQRAASSAREQVRFVQGFMHSYVPDSKPDVFLFRESLQYVSRNRKQARKELCTFLSRYADMLRANGVIIARLCADGSDAQRYAKTLEMIVREHFVLRECRWTQDPSALLIAFCPDVTR